MANSYRTSMRELDDDDVHRLLPREILEDIGVIVNPAERQVPDDVVDDLAARLAGVLGGAPMTKKPCHHHPQVNIGRGSLAGGKDTVRRVVAVPPPAVPWQVVEGLKRRNSMVAIHPTTPTPAWPPLAGGARPTTTVAARRGTGTGVFFPRTEVVRRAAKAAMSPPGNCSGSHAHAIHQRGHQAAVAIVKTQQEMRAEAAHMGVEALSWRPRSSASGARPATAMDLLNTEADNDPIDHGKSITTCKCREQA